MGAQRTGRKACHSEPVTDVTGVGIRFPGYLSKQIIVQICPRGVHRFNKLVFPGAVPAFQLLLPLNSGKDAGAFLVVDEFGYAIFRGGSAWLLCS